MDGSARDLSRLSLVLAAGQRELATAAINDAKRQRIAEREARDAAREEARKAAELQELLEEYDTMEKLLFRQMKVDQEIMMYESGVWKNEAEYERAKEVAEQLAETRREAHSLQQKVDKGARKLEEDLLVTDGVRLRHGDQLQCELRLDQPAHVYLLSYDSSGKLWRLFPETERLLPDAPPAAKNPLPKGAHWIPGREHFFILDENPGVETLYLVVARKPQPDLIALAKHVTTGEGDPTGALRRKLEGLAAQALSLAVESERNQGIALRGKDLLVRELRFTHAPR